MRISLLGRNKFSVVDVTFKKEKFREELWGPWERVNAIVLFWIMNSVTSNLLSGIM